MKDIIIVGTGGLAAEVTEYINNNRQHNLSLYQYQIKGYLSISSKDFKKYKFEKPLLGDERTYTLGPNDYVIIAIGIQEIRNKVIDILNKKNAEFINLIHHTVLVGANTNIGLGNIIAPYCIVGPNVSIGDFNILNYHTTVAHGCSIGSNNVFSPNVRVAGHARIDNNNFFGTSSNILPNMSIGSENKIKAGGTVDQNIANRSFFFPDIKNKSMTIF